MSHRSRSRKSGPASRRIPRAPFIVALVLLLAFGMLSVTFSLASAGEEPAIGQNALVMDIRESTSRRNLAIAEEDHSFSVSKKAQLDLADTAAAPDLGEVSANVDAASTGASTVKICYDVATGHDNDWDLAHKVAMDASGSDYATILTLSPNTKYYFFILNGSNYYKAEHTLTSNGAFKLSNYGSNNYGNSGNKCNYQTSSATEYVVTFGSDDKLTISPIDSSVELRWSVASGHDGDYNLSNTVTLTEAADNYTYTADVDLTNVKHYLFVKVGDHYYRAAIKLEEGGSVRQWDYGTSNYGNSADKTNLTPTNTGRYRFTWNNKYKTISVEQVCHYYTHVMLRNNTTLSYSQHGTYGNVDHTSTASETQSAVLSGYTFDGWYRGTTASSTSTSGLTAVSYSGSTNSITVPVVYTNVYHYYAFFTRNPVTLTFDHAGVTANTTQSVGYNLVPTQPADPTVTGYRFDGWFTDTTYTTAFNFSTAMTSDKTAFAKWTDVSKCEPSFASALQTLNIGETETYAATHALPSGGTHSAPLTFNYISSNTSVATVNASNGAVTAISAGTTTITATCTNSTYATADSYCTYTLTVNAPTISVSDITNATVNDKNVSVDTPTYTNPSTLRGTVTYTVTSGGSYVSITSDGKYTGKAPGTATVTATYNYSHNGYTATATDTFTIEVVEPTLTLNKSTLSLEEGRSDSSVSVSSSPAFTSNAWSLSNTGIVTAGSVASIVDNGNSVTITAGAYDNTTHTTTIYCTATYANGYEKTQSLTLTVTASSYVLRAYNGSTTRVIDHSMAYDATTGYYKYDFSLSASKTYTIKVHEGSKVYSDNNGSSNAITDSLPVTGSGKTFSEFTFNNNDNYYQYYYQVKTSIAGTYRFYYNPTNHIFYIEYPHKVTFNKNGVTTTAFPTDQMIIYNQTVDTSAMTTPAATGYVFAGWYTAATGGSVFDFTTPITSATTVYAHWNRTVTFTAVYRNATTSYSGTFPDSNNINPTLSGANTYDFQSDVTLSAGTAAGYKFDGIFSSNDDGATALTTDFDYTITKLSTASTPLAYYARYTKLLDVELTYTADHQQDNKPTNLSTVTLTATPTGGAGSYTMAFSYKKPGDSEFTALTNLTSNTASFIPEKVGTYTFKVVVTDAAGVTEETLIENVEVVKWTGQFSISTTRGDSSLTDAGETVTYTQYDNTGSTQTHTTVTNSVVGGSELHLAITRPAANPTDYYFADVTVTMGGTQIYHVTNYCGDINSTLTKVVTGNIVTTYTILEKPKVTLASDERIDTLSLGYKSDGEDTTADAAGTYHVDINSPITYAVTPKTGYYITAVTATSGIPTITPELPAAGIITTSMTVSADTTLTVTFHANPTVTVVQPQYGSIYVTSGTGDDEIYYFNGDSVEYGTQLKVHVYPNYGSQHYDSTHDYYTVGNVTATVNNVASNLPALASNVTTHTITDDTTYTASITYGDVSNPLIELPAVLKNYRRIFFTNVNGWSDLYVHYSNKTTDGYVIAHAAAEEGADPVPQHNVRMTSFYTNEHNQVVFYADIPASYKYVSFNTGLTGTPTEDGDDFVAEYYTAYGELRLTSNAFYSGSSSPYTLNAWSCRYADFRPMNSARTDFDDTMQAATGVNKAAVFQADYDFSADALEFTVTGSPATVSYSNGSLKITPTSNTKPYTLVKVSSKSSGIEKYYLVKIKLFELHSFEGIQRLYQISRFDNNSNILLKVIARGLALNFLYEYSAHNTADTYTRFTDPVANSDPTSINDIEYFFNTFSFLYTRYAFRGTEFFRTTVTEENDATTNDSAVRKAVFDLDASSGSGVVYLKNDTMADLDEYQIVARFDGDSETWQTLQPVSGEDKRYRTAIPEGATTVQFYLMYEDKYSADLTSVDTVVDGSPVYYYASSGSLDLTPGTVFVVDSLDEGAGCMQGSFTAFGN